MTSRSMAVYSLVLGVLYLVVGILEFVGGLGAGEIWLVADFALVPGDLFGGLMLVCISAVFFRGIPSLWIRRSSGLSFVMVGALLGLIYGVVYMVVLLSNGLGSILGFEEWVGWVWLEDIRPEIWLAVLVAPLSAWALDKIRKVTALV